MNKEELINHPAPSAGRLIRNTIGEPIPKSIPERILSEATERGKWVHESIESFFETGEYESRWEWEGYMEAFNEFMKAHVLKVIDVESCVVHKDLTCKGIIDLVCELDGEPTIIDFKTSSQPRHMDWELQLSVYEYIMRSNVPRVKHKLKVVRLLKDGSYKMLYYEPKLDLVESMIKLYNYKEGVNK